MIEGRLAPGKLFGFAGGLARPRGRDDLFGDFFGDRRVFLEKLPQIFIGDTFDDTADLGVTQFGFGLSLELRVGDFDRNDCGQSFARILTENANPVLSIFAVFEQVILGDVVVDRPGQGGAETGQMRAALDGIDIIDIGEQVFDIAVIVLDGYLDLDPFFFPLNIYRSAINDIFTFVEIFGE